MAFGFARADALEHIDARLGGVDRRLDGLEQRMDRVESRLDSVDKAVRDSERTTTRWVIGVGVAIVAIIIGLYGPMLAVLLQILARLPR